MKVQDKLTQNFREPARAFCREHQFFNVDLIEAAMERAADITLAQVTGVLRELTDELVVKRERANAPQ